MSSTTVLTSPQNYSTRRIVFSEVKEMPIPNTAFKYRRINISTKNSDGSVGDLLLPTDEVYSFGVAECTDNPQAPEGTPKKVNGYQMGLCLLDRENPTPEQKAFLEVFNAICERCKDHMFENKDKLGFEWESKNELRKMNPLSYKKDAVTKKVVAGATPILNAKMFSRKEKNGTITILSSVYSDTQVYDPKTIIGKRCMVKAVVKIDSIFIGADKFSLQVKLYEAKVRLLEQSLPSLLGRPTGLLTASTTGTMNDFDDGNGLTEETEEEAVVVEAPPPPPKEVKAERVSRKKQATQ